MKHVYYIVLFSVILQGCKNKSKTDEFPSAGTITYSIDYSKEIKNSSTIGLMPREMTLSFKDHKTHYSFKSMFNVFSLDFYSPSSYDSCSTLFKFIDDCLIHVGSVNSNFFFFDQDLNPEIEYSENETKEIVDLSCEKAIVKFDDHSTYPIYYTKSIDLNQPNRHTPFKEVPGVLLEFCIDYNGIRFHFEASEIDYSIPKDTAFEIPQNVKRSTKSEIEGLIITLMNNFQ